MIAHGILGLLVLIQQSGFYYCSAQFVVATHEGCSHEECEIGPLQSSLLQVEQDRSFRVMADRIASLEKLNESSVDVHSSRLGGASLEKLGKSSIDVHSITVGRSLERIFSNKHTLGHTSHLTWCISAGIFVVILALLFQAPGIITRVFESRRAAAEAHIPESVKGVEDQGNGVQGMLLISAWASCYILVSMSLIKYNEFLMDAARFPYPVNLTLCHQASGSLFMFAMYKSNPGTFKSLQGTRRDSTLSRETLLGGILPVAMCSAGQLVLSNTALIYCSVAFLQMMKEGNIVFVYMLSLLVGLEVFRSLRMQLLLGLLLSTALTIQGELEFSFQGFIIQGTSQLMEATKIVLQGILMSAAGSKHLDPYTFNLIVQPITSILLLIFLVSCLTFITTVPTASVADCLQWAPHLLVNCCVALALNVTVANFFAVASPISYVIVGILKDIVIILVDVLVSGTLISGLQIGAFALQVLFVAGYSFQKMFQKEIDGKTRLDSKK